MEDFEVNRKSWTNLEDHFIFLPFFDTIIKGDDLMELLFVFAMILIVLYYFYQKRPKTHFPTTLIKIIKNMYLTIKR